MIDDEVMKNFAVVRLGKDSVADIRRIDSLRQSPNQPLRLTVDCKQVPTDLAEGDYIFICFGSDNSQGAPTDWVRGVRAFGTVAEKIGGPGYNDPWHVTIDISVILPESIVRKDLLAHAPTAYFWCSGIPTIGIEANSQQTIQMIKDRQDDQNVSALFYSLAAHSPVLKTDMMAKHPELTELFDYSPQSPIAGSDNPADSRAAEIPIELSGMVDQFDTDVVAANLRIVRASTLRFLGSLLAKRFLILTGLSGSGKTKLAQAFAHWISPSEDFFKIIPVGADWTGNENILGYPDGLNEAAYVTKPALDLILHAMQHGERPHFLILDEMNLSHVERYFADILSMIESEAKIHLHGGGGRKAGETLIPEFVEIPKNLFIIGTVNVDETTYMFSPKVLDRANVIEFRMDDKEMGAFLGNPAKPDLSKLAMEGKQFGDAFVAAASEVVHVPAQVKRRFDAEMLVFFKSLQAHGAEFGFRTAYEASRFVHFYEVLGDQSEGDGAWFDEAFDCLILQKLLPKLHGSRAKLEPILRALWDLCVIPVESRTTAPESDKTFGGGSGEAEEEKKPVVGGSQKSIPTKDIPPGSPYPLSAEKIYRMWRLMMENGFASFAEA